MIGDRPGAYGYYTAAEHDARVTELLAANNAEVEKRRDLQASLDRVKAVLLEHHTWQYRQGEQPFDMGGGEIVMLNMSDEYGDSGLCERTMAALWPYSPSEREEPTARGDRIAGLMRTHYEANREGWWDRLWKRWRYTSDNLMLGLLNIADRELRRSR